ncbi:MAG TPA: hypothetical protein VF376_10985, partial [Thermoanaerobaculia bacterium]
MKSKSHRLPLICLAGLCLVSAAAFGQSAGPTKIPQLSYDVLRDFFQLPPGENFVEAAGVAVNSKGHIYVFHRGKHPL